jgi:uncharacterized membrane protein YkvI
MSENLQTVASKRQSDKLRGLKRPLMKLRRHANKFLFVIVNIFKAICMVAAIFAILCIIVIAIGGLLLASYELGGWTGVVFTILALLGLFFLSQWGR